MQAKDTYYIIMSHDSDNIPSSENKGHFAERGGSWCQCCRRRWFHWGGGGGSLTRRRARLVASNAVVAGVEVASAVAFTVLPPLMLKIGFRESTMSIILGIGEKISLIFMLCWKSQAPFVLLLPAPFIAILTVSWLGKWSDLLGRRKPFILALCVLLIVSLILLIGVQNLLALEGTKAIGYIAQNCGKYRVTKYLVVVDLAFADIKVGSSRDLYLPKI